MPWYFVPLTSQRVNPILDPFSSVVPVMTPRVWMSSEAVTDTTIGDPSSVVMPTGSGNCVQAASIAQVITALSVSL